MATAQVFLNAPFYLGPNLGNLIVDQVESWLRSVFPGTAAQATAAASATPTVTVKPMADKLIEQVTTTDNAMKGRIGAVAPKRTGLPKPLNAATTDDPVVGEPQVSGNEPSADSGLLRAAVTSTSDLDKAVTSTKGNLRKAVKRDTGTIGKKAQDSQNSTVRSGAARTHAR